MSQEHPYRIFVTHGWQEDEDYLRVFEYLEESNRFYYRNVANAAAPRPPNADGQREVLRSQMGQCEIVVALAGQYAQHSADLEFQLVFAQAVKKPIIALRAFGSQASVPKTIAAAAKEILDWDARALVAAIRRHARGEGGQAWDTVEFKLE